MIDSDESIAIVWTPSILDTLPCIEPPNVNEIVDEFAVATALVDTVDEVLP